MNHSHDSWRTNQQILEAISRAIMPPNSSHLRWIGVFSRLVLLAAKGYFQDMTLCFFYVDNASQLSPLLEAVIDYPYVMEHKLRVIGYIDRRWYIDSP